MGIGAGAFSSCTCVVRQSLLPTKQNGAKLFFGGLHHALASTQESKRPAECPQSAASTEGPHNQTHQTAEAASASQAACATRIRILLA